MILRRRSLSFLHLLLLLLLATCIGCEGCVPDEYVEGDPTSEGSESKGEGEGAEAGEDAENFVLADLVEPFDPPTLEELNAQVTWIDQPVRDSMELMRKRQAGEEVLCTTEEALALRNNSPEDNDKILSALGRMAPSDSAVDWDASIVRHTSGDVKSTNPMMLSSSAEFEVNGMTNFGLFSFDWNFVPHAVKETVVSWQTSEDRTIDKVVIRDDLTWSDGKPITAHDVEFSFKVIMSSAVPVPAQRSGTDKIKWVKAYDDHTLVFFHKEALATNIWNVNFSVIPKHIYEKSIRKDPTLQESDYHVKYESDPVVGGPYIITKRQRGQEIVLARREAWYMHEGEQVRDKPYFKEIRFRVIIEPSVALLALKKGEIEEMILNPEQWKTQTNDDEFYKKNIKASGVEWVYFHFVWNCKTAFFDDVRVRTAMSYAFDHKELLEKLRYGLDEPCNGVFHRTSRWAPKDPPAPYTRDLDKAEELLEEAGWLDHDGDGILDKEIGGRTVPFEFSVLCANTPNSIAASSLLRESLDQIGITCNVKPLEFTVLQEKMRKHQFQAAFGGWGTGADPDTSENIWGTDEGRNYGQYSNPEIDRLFAEGRREFDPEKRAEIYGRIHEILYADQPYTWLFFRNAFYGFNKDLRGYTFSPRGPYSYGPGFGSIWKPAAH